jgi:hypothetical protein
MLLSPSSNLISWSALESKPSTDGFSIAPSGSTCYDYTSINGEKFKVSIVIVPVSIRTGSDLRIVWCCNRGLHCYNPSCIYSRVNRRSKRE